ncbi:FAD/NAD(P)-binding protein [Lactobacillaceae bacterium Melli_B4]
MNIGIIGGGPRGLISLNHLINNFQSSNESKLDIHLFDSFPAGGQVWRTDQPTDLIMNTIAGDILLFDKRFDEGLSLYQWSQTKAVDYIHAHPEFNQHLAELAQQLTDNSYSPRALVGVYAHWFYDQITSQLPDGVSVTYHRLLADNLKPVAKQWQLSSDGHDFTFDQVVVTINTSVSQLSETEQSLADYAAENGLYYLAPAYPGDIDHHDLTADDKVIIRGLGMSFFDEVAKMTTARGGTFTEKEDGKLEYHPSGNEPHIFAGSRRGTTYYPKPMIYPDRDYQFTAHFLTPENIDSIKQGGQLKVDQFRQLIRHEIELVYYQLILQNNHPDADVEQFTNDFVANPTQAINQGPFKPNEILRWPQLLNPVAGTPITTTADYQGTLLNWLDAVAHDAVDGLGKGPLASALNIYKEARQTIRDTIANDDFSVDDYVQNFLTTFNSNSQMLSNGAPAIRLRQMAALIRAGVLTILGPQMNVIGANHHFVAMSKYYPKEPVMADALIEARIPKLKIMNAKNSLISSLFQNDIFQPADVELADGKHVQLNAVNIDPDTDQAVMANGEVAKGLFVFSTLTEGIHWLTTVFPMVGNDDNQNSANQISRQILNLPIQNQDMM